MSVLLRTVVAAHLLLAGGASRLRTAISSTGIAFDYSKHGQDWVQGTCASRARQSPIDFPHRLTLIPSEGKLFYSYQRVATSFEMSNNGHTFSIDLGGMGFGGITYDNAWYNLLNVNVHAVSEHTFDGVHHPVEIHLVHKKYDSDALLIVAIPVTSEKPPPTFLQLNKTTTDKKMRAQREHQANGASQPAAPPPAPSPGAPIAAPYVPPSEDEPNFNKQIQAFLKTNPPPVNMKAEVTMLASDPLDLNQLYEGGVFYEYPGSTTAPPCAEVAVWMVRSDPLMASDQQVPTCTMEFSR
jgi:carbonic anhydrase